MREFCAKSTALELLAAIQELFRPPVKGAAEEEVTSLYSMKWLGSINAQLQKAIDFLYIAKKGISKDFTDHEKIQFIVRAKTFARILNAKPHLDYRLNQYNLFLNYADLDDNQIIFI